MKLTDIAKAAMCHLVNLGATRASFNLHNTGNDTVVVLNFYSQERVENIELWLATDSDLEALKADISHWYHKKSL